MHSHKGWISSSHLQDYQFSPFYLLASHEGESFLLLPSRSKNIPVYILAFFVSSSKPSHFAFSPLKIPHQKMLLSNTLPLPLSLLSTASLSATSASSHHHCHQSASRQPSSRALPSSTALTPTPPLSSPPYPPSSRFTTPSSSSSSLSRCIAQEPEDATAIVQTVERLRRIDAAVVGNGEWRIGS